jgi:hypothetical protein
MGLPSQPVTLTVEQIDELNKKVAKLRHDVNNYLALIVAATEMIKFKPDMAAKMVATMAEQPARIGNAINAFSDEFEKTFGITRDSKKF